MINHPVNTGNPGLPALAGIRNSESRRLEQSLSHYFRTMFSGPGWLNSQPASPALWTAISDDPLSVVSRLGVLIQAVLPRADLMVTHVGVDHAAPTVAAGPFCGPRATAGLVEMVADWLSIVSCPLGLG